LTTVCLAASWYFFDRKDFEDEEESGETQRAEREV
jgi:hypothetical protein